MDCRLVKIWPICSGRFCKPSERFQHFLYPSTLQTWIFCVWPPKVSNIILKVHNFQLPTKRQSPPLQNHHQTKRRSKTRSGFHLTNFDCYRGALPDFESGVFDVHLAWNFVLFEYQNPKLRNSKICKTVFFRVRLRYWLSGSEIKILRNSPKSQEHFWGLV